MPRGQRGLLLRALGTAGAHTTRLQAVYADTAGRHLAAAGMALRLRKEGRCWVQTLKGRGDGLASRFEHEVALTGVPGLPTLDARLHEGTALAGPLQRALQAGGALQPVYQTDIQRLHRKLRFQSAIIEVALDRGHLMAGASRLPVHEIEFELISGPAVALPALAAQWAAKHALWWDVRTKSERGFRLAHGLATVAPVTAMRGGFEAKPDADTGGAAWAALLNHLLPNAAELAGGSGSGSAAHQAELLLALQALTLALRPLDLDAAAQADRLLVGLQALKDAGHVARSKPFTALMLRVLAMTMAAPLPA